MCRPTARVQYQDVYPGIDLVYYGNQRQLEYDFVVSPGADPSSIALGFRGAEQLEVDGEGDLVLHTAARHDPPAKAGHLPGGRRRPAGDRGRLRAQGPEQVGFQVGRL